jgi:hypothetical protein
MEKIDKIIEKIESENLAYYSVDEVINILLDIKKVDVYRVIESQKKNIEMLHNLLKKCKDNQ